MTTLQYPITKVVDTTDKIHTIVSELRNNEGTGGSNDTQILNAMAGDTYFDVEFIQSGAYGNTNPYYQVSGKLRSFDFVGYLGTYNLNSNGYINIQKVETALTDPNIIFINGTKIYNQSALYPYYMFPYAASNGGHGDTITEYSQNYLIRLHSLNTEYNKDSTTTYYCILFDFYNRNKNTDGTIKLYQYNVFTNKFDQNVNTDVNDVNILPIHKYIQNDIYYITASSNIFNYSNDNIGSLFCANNSPAQSTTATATAQIID